MPEYITISRKWNNPKIYTTLTNDGIGMTMSVDDFIAALKQEIGSVRWIFRNETFARIVDAAAQAVIEGVKEESAKVV